MMEDDFEGVLAARFSARFATATPTADTASSRQKATEFGAVDRAERKTRERKATRTPAQRARAKTRTKMVNFKTTPETKALLAKLAKARGMNMTAVIELGIELVAQQTQPKKGTADA